MSPTLTKDTETGVITIVEPERLAGRQVVAVDGIPCGKRYDEWHHASMCGLVAGHRHECWQCATELVEREGPWAVVQ